MVNTSTIDLWTVSHDDVDDTKQLGELSYTAQSILRQLLRR